MAKRRGNDYEKLKKERQKRAKKEFSLMCRALEKKGIAYERDEENMYAKFTSGSDYYKESSRLLRESGEKTEQLNCYFRPLDFTEFAYLYTHYPFAVSYDQKASISVAVALLNWRELGCIFNYNFRSGTFEISEKLFYRGVGIGIGDYEKMIEDFRWAVWFGFLFVRKILRNHTPPDRVAESFAEVWDALGKEDEVFIRSLSDERGEKA